MPERLTRANADRERGRERRPSGYCGSTSTLTLTPLRAAAGAITSTARPTAAIA